MSFYLFIYLFLLGLENFNLCVIHNMEQLLIDRSAERTLVPIHLSVFVSKTVLKQSKN